MAQTNSMGGMVSLIGAGPGDPELITVRGLRVLREADVVLYDALVDERLLAECRTGAELIDVGKRAAGAEPPPPNPSHHNALAQERINALLVAKAREGRRVVRLKGGDPLIFGRAGEELEALAAAGISCEIVPGVTAATAAAAQAQLPLTRRAAGGSLAGSSRGVLLITGHPAAGTAAAGTTASAAVSWESVAAIAPSVTVCVYMGLKNLPQIARRLLDAGLAPQTCVTIVSNASLPSAQVFETTLAGAAAAAGSDGADNATDGLPSPALVLISSNSPQHYVSPPPRK